MNETPNPSTLTSAATTTHTGKIGRLPRSIREELGQRIDDGRPGTEIVQWLNEQPQVQAVLAEFFGARPINEQNLSDWKQSGHPDWLRRRDACDAVQRLIELSSDLEDASGITSLCDRFAVVVAAEMTRIAMALLETETDLEKRWKRLCEIQRQLSQLRRDDHRSVQIAIRREQWAKEAKRQVQEEEQREGLARHQQRTNHLVADLVRDAHAERFDDSEKGRQLADTLFRLKFGLPEIEPLPNGQADSANSPANSKESRLIKPNKGK